MDTESMKSATVLTFMSWYNRYNGENVRAVALCDSTGFFYSAINCMRDGSMGEKGEDGVYSRIWWNDYIQSDEVGLRPANAEEIKLYLAHCPLESQMEWDDLQARVICQGTGINGTHVVVEHYKPTWRTCLRRRFQKFTSCLVKTASHYSFL